MRGSPLVHLTITALAFLLLAGGVGLLAWPKAESTPSAQASEVPSLEHPLRFTVESPLPLRNLRVLLADRVLWQSPDDPEAAPRRLSGDFLVPADSAELVWVVNFLDSVHDEPTALRIRYRWADGPRESESFWGRGAQLEAVLKLERKEP